jgi:hypothetical protein
VSQQRYEELRQQQQQQQPAPNPVLPIQDAPVLPPLAPASSPEAELASPLPPPAVPN